MKIFISIKKKWLQHRVYKYTLKYQDSLSKSDSLFQLSNSYDNVAHYCEDYDYYLDNCELCQKYKFKSEHYKHLSEIYLSKKLDLEEELQYLTYRKT